MTITSPSRPLRLGTRRSRLATTQSGWVADRLRSLGHEVELVEVVTEGDVNHAPLAQIGGTGVFASALRQALRAGEVDLAVHSLKDLPVLPEPGLVIAALPPREDPRDVLVARDGLGLAALPQGASVGTGSPRRAAQLRAHRPDLTVREIRGNVDGRIRRTESGELDAVVLAGAGLRRLGRHDDVTDIIDLTVMLPAAGQGALAVECRETDERVSAILRQLDDEETRACVTAERALLRTLEAGCTAPIGALGSLVDQRLRLEAFVGNDDGTFGVRRSASGDPADPWSLGEALAADLIRAADGHLVGGVPTRPPESPVSATPADHTHRPSGGALKEQTP